MTVRIDLRDRWTLNVAGQPAPNTPPAVAERTVPAAVPGCVHTDLLAAGLIPDPYLDANETTLTWIGRTDWRYRTTLDVTTVADAERVDLVCEGLDTVAELRLNDHELGRTRNMHRGYRFDVGPALRDGDNELTVTFTSPYHHAEELRNRLGHRPGPYHPEPYPFIRKMACNFGWDWGPTVVTAGVWRPIYLQAWNTARVAQVRPEITVDTAPDGTPEGVVRLRVEVERSGAPGSQEATLTLSAAVAGARLRGEIPPGATSADLELRVPDVHLWWPRGHGAQPLYELDLTLTGPGGAHLDTWSRRVGFRTVELDTTPDADGTPFTLRVNGHAVAVRGANWIPDDAFVTRVDRDRYARRIDAAVAANMNLLRVWGGGRYEDEAFYELCDERGVLVWQDFLFACAAYPEEEPLRSEVLAEARDNVVRLAPYPSLVLWNGNNENIWGYHDWGWPWELEGRSWGETYYLELLPAIVAELDPTRPYWPGSPYSGPDRHPNDPAHGPMHVWDVWNEVDYRHYRDHRPRFVAEFGFQAPPAHATLRAAVSDDPLRPDSPGVLHHQKAEDGNGKLARGMLPHFGAPEDFDDWHYLTQVNQARAITLGIEHYRSLWPLCTGTIVWQLNDCWPVTSWAAIDGAGRRKPLWYALRRCYAERLATLQPEGDGDGVALVLVNDSGAEWSGTARLARSGFDGTVLAEYSRAYRVPPRGALRIEVPEVVARPGDTRREVLTADTGADRAWWFFAEDVDLDYPEPDFDTEFQQRGPDLEVTVVARTLLRDLALFADRVAPEAEVDDMLVTLLPGESHTFTIHGGARLEDRKALVRAPVLRCVNEALPS